MKVGEGRLLPFDAFTLLALRGFSDHLPQMFPVTEQDDMILMAVDMEVDVTVDIEAFPEDGLKYFLGQGLGTQREMRVPIEKFLFQEMEGGFFQGYF